MFYALVAFLVSLCATIGAFYLFELLNETIKILRTWQHIWNWTCLGPYLCLTSSRGMAVVGNQLCN